MKNFLFTDAKVYCGTYHKYNSGSLAGEWIDLFDYNDEDELMEHLRELHSDEEDPEFMFQDKENFPDFICGEGEPTLSDVARCIDLCNYLWDERYSEEIIEAAANVHDFRQMEPHEIEKWLDKHYIGQLSTTEAAENILRDIGVPEWLWRYIDLEELGESKLEDYDESDGYYFYNY